MNHSRWHYIQGLTSELLDKIGYYNLRSYVHDKCTNLFIRPDLQGWFSKANQQALRQTLNSHCSNKGDLKILEIGSWKGLSTSLIAEFALARNGQVYCVDTWQGNEGVGALHKTAQYRDILAIFRRNMKLMGYGGIVHPMAGKSCEVLPLLRDKSFDLIFIDADHRKTPFLYDLGQALRLVKDDGVICGDDCDEVYQPTKQAIYDQHCEEDYYDKVHCGVVLALHETIGFERIDLLNGSSFWVHRKNC